MAVAPRVHVISERMPGPEPSSSETALLAALRCGDENAFSALVTAYGAAMHRVALTFVRSSAVADEVVQEAWLGALRGLDRFEGRSTLRTWLLRIVANIARTHAVVAPIPPSAPQIPSALFRSEPSVKVAEMIDRAVGVMIAGALDHACRQQRRRRPGQPAQQRRSREEHGAGHEHAPAPEQVSARPPSSSRPPKVSA
jgi:RNA polymerase sigma factor (sigma-70 family)